MGNSYPPSLPKLPRWRNHHANNTSRRRQLQGASVKSAVGCGVCGGLRALHKRGCRWGLWQFGARPTHPLPLLAYAKPRVAPNSRRYPLQSTVIPPNYRYPFRLMLCPGTTSIWWHNGREGRHKPRKPQPGVGWHSSCESCAVFRTMCPGTNPANCHKPRETPARGGGGDPGLRTVRFCEGCAVFRRL